MFFSYQGYILLYCSIVVVLSGFSFCHFSLLFPNFFSGLETGIQSNMVFTSIFMCVAVVKVVVLAGIFIYHGS